MEEVKPAATGSENATQEQGYLMAYDILPCLDNNPLDTALQRNSVRKCKRNLR